MDPLGAAQCATAPAELGGKPHAPTQQTLVEILQGNRRELLEKLRDTEQLIEQLEANPNFESTFMRVNKILQRGRY